MIWNKDDGTAADFIAPRPGPARPGPVRSQHHPYELPEIIALPIVRGRPAYLDGVAAETWPSD